MASSRQRAGRRDSEAGFMLVAVLFLVALVLIALAVAAPRISQSIQRDKELELVHRGEQYKRAIKLYYRKFGAYPASIDQLVNTNNIRFLRKRYTDPMTNKDDWKLIHFGEAHVKAMGLFGQPISNGGNSTTAGSSALGGTGPGIAGATSAGGLGSTIGSGSITSGSTTSGSSTSDPTTTGSSTTGSSGFGSEGSTPGGLGGSTTGGLGSGTGNTNPTLGGGPIVGVAIPDTKASIKEYKKQKHYNEWEFVYDPLEDQLQAGTLFGGTPQNLNGVGNGTTSPTNGTGFSGTGFGSSTSGTGSSGTGGTSTTPTPQQQ